MWREGIGEGARKVRGKAGQLVQRDALAEEALMSADKRRLHGGCVVCMGILLPSGCRHSWV